MKQRTISRRRRYPRLLREYTQILERRVRNGEIIEETRAQYLNDAQVVMECLVAALPEEDILKTVRQQRYKGYYKNIIRDLKAVMARQTL